MRIIFCAVPYVETPAPIMAPAVLKAVAEKEGHTAFGIDLNIIFMNNIQDYDHREQVIDYLLNQVPSGIEVYSILTEMVDHFTDLILEYNPDVIGLSLLTYQSQIFTHWLAATIKQRRPDIKIMIGGSGIKNFIADSNNSYCETLKGLGLIDHYIMGDGEAALVNYLRGNNGYDGIDTPTWIQATNADLEEYPYPNYDDYDFEFYPQKELGVVDSRGCVRTCEFCDIIEHWTKFTYRPAESVFNEMVHQAEKYGIRHFHMKDSLANGNMKVFTKLVDLLADYNLSNPPEKQITWHAYFIIRNAQQHPESLFARMQDAGALLELGVESAIRRVRWEMGKKFENEDIDWHLEMGQKYGIPLMLLCIVAYPTETLEDWEFTKQWFKDRLKYAQNSVILTQLAWPSILPNTKLARKSDEYGIKQGRYSAVWFNQNLKITNQMKIEYMHELYQICEPYSGIYRNDVGYSAQDSALRLANQYSDEVEQDEN
jgi:radical SAM superfamily enzyme YgiQ (UPF0313 family)